MAEKEHDVEAPYETTLTETTSQPLTTTEVVDPYGGLHRGLKERHVQFIALGGTIGTGLFLNIGVALATSGPLSLLLGYTFSSVAIWIMMQCLGEMTALLPLPGMIAQLGTRFVDPALGFAMGWNQWLNCGITICAETSAVIVLIEYWIDLNSAIWVTIILIVLVLLNVFAVSLYGEAEFMFASIKILAILGLLILALVIDVGGAPKEGRLGFHYWKDPGPMKEYIAGGSTGRFLGLFNTLINAAFAYGGIEQVAVAAGETKNPRRNIPKAIRRVFWRLLFFYILGTLAVGVLVSSDNPNLVHNSGVSQSPYTIAIRNAGIPALPSILNAVVITSAFSAGNANLYSGSRYLYALAKQGQAPRIFLRCTKKGVPIYAMGITASIGLLSYITVSNSGSTVFHWFTSIVTVAYLITWLCVCYAYTRFRKALVAGNIDRKTLPFRGLGGVYGAWGSITFFAIVLIFNGFAVFTKGHWKFSSFFSAYIGLLIFGLLYVFWKLFKKTKVIPIHEMDLYTGQVAELEEVVGTQYSKNVRNTLSKIMSKVF